MYGYQTKQCSVVRWLRTSEHILERKQGGSRSRLPPFPSFFLSPEAHIAEDTATTPVEPEQQTLVVRLRNEASTIIRVIIFAKQPPCLLSLVYVPRALEIRPDRVSGAW